VSFTIKESSNHTAAPVGEQPDFHISPEQFFRAHQIVQAHGGAIEIEHAPDSGLTITVRIPVPTHLFADEGAESPTAPPATPDLVRVNRSPSQDNDPTDGVQNASCSHSPCNYPSEAQPFEASYET
jgi:hypothetical protein